MPEVILGHEAWQSEEFRTFAILWLGFDPESEEFKNKVQGCTIHLNHHEKVTYELKMLAREQTA